MAKRLISTIPLVMPLAISIMDLICSLLNSFDDGLKSSLHSRTAFPALVQAKGVAGLGKAGGEGSSGTDKTGQQVPPEVYNAITYAGTAFLFTLSVPLILYGLNKLLNKIEDCFGCGPSSRRKRKQLQLQQQKQQMQSSKMQSLLSMVNPTMSPKQQLPSSLAFPLSESLAELTTPIKPLAIAHELNQQQQEHNNSPTMLLNNQQQPFIISASPHL